jgi:hypothetical protein
MFIRRPQIAPAQCDEDQTNRLPAASRGAHRGSGTNGRATPFVTNVNRTVAIDTTMRSNLQREDAMGVKPKSVTLRGAARKHAAQATRRRGRRTATAPEAWEQAAQVRDDRDGELDCQRIVQDEGSRSLPRYYDDYN